MAGIGTPQLIIVLLIVLLLFGAKRLPEAARGIGRSLKIFKTETQGLIGDDKQSDVTGEADSTPQAQQTAPRAVEPTTPQAAAPAQPASETTADQSQRDA